MTTRTAIGLLLLVLASACGASQEHAQNPEPSEHCTASNSDETCNVDADCCSGSCSYEGGYCQGARARR